MIQKTKLIVDPNVYYSSEASPYNMNIVDPNVVDPNVCYSSKASPYNVNIVDPNDVDPNLSNLTQIDACQIEDNYK